MDALSRRTGLLPLYAISLSLFLLLAFWTTSPTSFSNGLYRLRKGLDMQTPSLPPTVSNPWLNKLFFKDNFIDGRPHTRSNQESLRRLFDCMQASSCGPNQESIIITGSYHFWKGVFDGSNSGEDIWAQSTVRALNNLEYTILHASNMARAAQLYELFPDMVQALILEASELKKCWEDEDDCLRSELHPHGIPVWKTFAFTFWQQIEHPLGRFWTLSPEPYALDHPEPNTYLGYSVESSCLSTPYIPLSERPREGFLYSKSLGYLSRTDNPPAWSPDALKKAVDAAGVVIVMGANGNTEETVAARPYLDVVTNKGVFQKAEFAPALSRMRVLIGIGQPFTSPTPHEALCMGVPFINPISSWDGNNRTDRRAWSSQHSILKYMDPPFVYNVFKDDEEGFVEAFKAAVSTPIDRYIPDGMRMSSIEARLDAIIKKDWKAEAQQLLEELKLLGEDDFFII